MEINSIEMYEAPKVEIIEVEVEKGGMKQGTTSEDNPRTHLSYR